jgi:hypothetical protein
LVISKAPVEISLSGLQHTYDGTAKSAIATTSPPGLNVALTYNGITNPPHNAGSYSVLATVNGVNYTGTADGTLTVSPAVLTVTANDASRKYGVANPSFSGTITGLQNADNITATYSTPATPASPVGTYEIVPALFDPDGKLANYSQILNNGILTVELEDKWVRANIARNNKGQLVITWPATGDNYTLESSENLGTTAQWTPVVVEDQSREVTINPDSPRRFYRLRKL